jgi:hypothetical protein
VDLEHAVLADPAHQQINTLALDLPRALSGFSLEKLDLTTVVAALLKASGSRSSDGGGRRRFSAHPLWYAVARGENLRLVRFLLTRGGDASYSLWAAVWRDDDVVFRELLKNRPRLNLRAHGETPIFYAARLKRLKTLDLLIEAGADPTIVDKEGRDAIDIARARRLPKNFIDRLADSKQPHPTNELQPLTPPLLS